MALEGIRRIGKVVDEQVALYETITGEFRLPTPDSAAGAASSDAGSEPDTKELDAPSADVLPLRRREEP